MEYKNINIFGVLKIFWNNKIYIFFICFSTLMLMNIFFKNQQLYKVQITGEITIPSTAFFNKSTYSLLSNTYFIKTYFNSFSSKFYNKENFNNWKYVQLQINPKLKSSINFNIITSIKTKKLNAYAISLSLISNINDDQIIKNILEYANYTNDKVSSKTRSAVNKVMERITLLKDFYKNNTYDDYFSVYFFQSNQWKENKFAVFKVQSNFNLISMPNKTRNILGLLCSFFLALFVIIIMHSYKKQKLKHLSD